MSDEDELADLRHHWGEAYSLMRGRDGWQAKRRDSRGGWIARPTADELRAAIRDDYARCPVRRAHETGDNQA